MTNLNGLRWLLFPNIHSKKKIPQQTLTAGIVTQLYYILGFPGGSVDKESACNARDAGEVGFIFPWVGKISWSRAWPPTPVFLPGEFHGQRSHD